jgi:hypothetical protein
MRIGSEILLDLPSGDEEESLLDVRNLKNLVRHGEGLRRRRAAAHRDVHGSAMDAPD